MFLESHSRHEEPVLSLRCLTFCTPALPLYPDLRIGSFLLSLRLFREICVQVNSPRSVGNRGVEFRNGGKSLSVVCLDNPDIAFHCKVTDRSLKSRATGPGLYRFCECNLRLKGSGGGSFRCCMAKGRRGVIGGREALIRRCQPAARGRGA